MAKEPQVGGLMRARILSASTFLSTLIFLSPSIALSLTRVGLEGSGQPGADTTRAQASACDCQEEDCVRFGRQATLLGRIAEESRFGPPGYGEDPKTDKMITIFVIVLDRPVCVQPRGSGDDIANVHRIQIAGDLGVSRAGELVGRRAVATGILFEANSGYHYMPVLIDVSRSRSASKLDAREQ
jgi:hypothetical protein